MTPVSPDRPFPRVVPSPMPKNAIPSPVSEKMSGPWAGTTRLSPKPWKLPSRGDSSFECLGLPVLDPLGSGARLAPLNSRRAGTAAHPHRHGPTTATCSTAAGDGSPRATPLPVRPVGVDVDPSRAPPVASPGRHPEIPARDLPVFICSLSRASPGRSSSWSPPGRSTPLSRPTRRADLRDGQPGAAADSLSTAERRVVEGAAGLRPVSAAATCVGQGPGERESYRGGGGGGEGAAGWVARTDRSSRESKGSTRLGAPTAMTGFCGGSVGTGQSRARF